MTEELCEHRCSRGAHCGGCGCPGCGYPVEICRTPGCEARAVCMVLIPAKLESEGDRDYVAPFCAEHGEKIVTLDRGARIV